MPNFFETDRFATAYNSFRRNEPTLLSINSYVTTLFEARMRVRHEWNRRLNGAVWIGPDITLDRDLLSSPDYVSFASIELNSQQMFPFPEFHPYVVSCALGTMRSRFAQLGPMIVEGTSSEIARTLSIKERLDSLIRYNAKVPIFNFAKRPIFLPKGTKLFYLYYWDGKTVKGRELKELVGNKILISDNDRSWNWWHWPNTNHTEDNIAGIEFIIDEQTRKWVPPNKEPMLINDGPASNHNRQEVDRYLEGPIPQTADPILWIAQIKARLKLIPGVHGIVDTMIPRKLTSPLGDQERQMDSVMLRGDNTDSHIRTEIISPTTEELIPRSIVIRFIKA